MGKKEFLKELEIKFDEIEFDQYAEIIHLDGQLSVHIRKGSIMHPTLTIRIKNEMTYSINNRSQNVIFQPEIKLFSDSGWNDVRKAEDPIREDKTMSILYNDSNVLALGHNVGVNWNDDRKIWTDFLPQFDMMKMKEDPDLSSLIPDMELLCDEKRFEEACSTLDLFLNEYLQWIEDNEESLNLKISNGLIPEYLHGQCNKLISEGRINLSRMREGVEFLRSDDYAKKSFILANKAILKSQVEATHPDVAGRTSFKWKPFQLAFQLLNIRSLCALEPSDSGFEEREIMDLAWFPTGGGKTEAYLGMIATIGFYRRIRFPEKELIRPSVHAIMRYTLRLLTSDQADRLVRLVGAMNSVANNHDSNHKFFDFRVGMWVGSDASPNDLPIQMQTDLMLKEI